MTALHLAVALDGAGWHPAAWRVHRPALFTADWWAGLVAEAERGLLDFVTIEDSLGLQSESPFATVDRTDRVRGRLDAVLIAARIAPLTTHIGIVPTVTTTHTEPFHIASAIATLDYVSTGRAGWRAQVSGRASEAAHVGRWEVPVLDPAHIDPANIDPEVYRPLFDEAADAIEVVRRLWDSWEDDAIIRDVATGRFVDNRKLHYIDFVGGRFSVKGPSIVPRPPQGQPLVTVLGHASVPYRLGVLGADVLYVTPHSTVQAAEIVSEVRALVRAERPDGVPLKIFGDLVVFLDPEPGAARRRHERLDALDELASDAQIFAGTPGELADLLVEWQAAGLEGFRLRPGVLPDDLTVIARDLTAELRSRGLFRSEYPGTTLRASLGLERPVSRYAGSPA